ncbi:MAG: LytR/AlgR family response regulator transcription factor [Brevundimonas sp.]
MTVLQTASSAFRHPDAGAIRKVGLWALAIAAMWATVALVLSGQAYLVGLYVGRPQAWWPSFGYALAIFSVWALMTAPIVAAARWVEVRRPRLAVRIALHSLGLPVAAAVHVLLFALIYWPLYNDGGRIPGRWVMAERMFVRNFDTNTLLYVALVASVVAFGMWRRRRPAMAPEVEGPRMLEARSRRGRRHIPLVDIDWISAAGNYAEVHVGGETCLIDESLTSLTRRLPASEFARVHRGALVRLDRVVAVRGVGRGDALITLSNGSELRLSRRYRAGFLTGVRSAPDERSR